MGRCLLPLLLLIAASGCQTHLALRDRAVKVPGTWADIHHQQVLNNIACFAQNPSTLPSFAVANGGVVQMVDEKAAGVSPTYAPTLTFALQGGGALPILGILFQSGARREAAENWTLIPTADPDNIRRLQMAFQLLFLDPNSPEAVDPRRELADFFLIEERELAERIPQGWVQVGRKKDVPKDACYVGRCCDAYAWVTRAGLDGMTRFTLTVLDLSTGELHRPQRTIVKTYKGAEKPENLESTQVTFSDVDREALDAVRKSRSKPDRERVTDDPSKGSRGLFFVPQ